VILGAIWRLLVGPLPLRVFQAVVLVAAVVWLCFAVVFPWLADSVLPQPDGAVGTS
jgi:hypothetical protein